MRPYQDHTRAEIAARLAEIDRERTLVLSACQRLEAELAALENSLVSEERKRWGGSRTVRREKTREEQARTAANLTKQIELQQLRGNLAKTVQELNFELHVRDTPELVQEFGPGRD